MADTSIMNGVDVSELAKLATFADQLGADRIASEARALAERVAEGRFYVACMGQFKRGKSTLISALINDSVLPAGFTPITAVPTVIRHGEHRWARVRTKDGAWQEIAVSELAEYVSEEHNPENQKRVDAAEVYVPSPLLASGMCFVDTPGLGSVFTGNSAATRAFIPHIDAALVVTGADPPLAGEELALVEAVAKDVRDVILVLNKSDRTTDEERSAAAAFAQMQLKKRLGRQVESVFQVSALERLENRGPERDWAKLVERLQRLVDDSGRQLVLAACVRGLERLSEQLLSIVSEEREALQRPIEESERRIATMKQTIADAERSMRDLGYLFMGEQQGISDLFLDRRKAFLATVSPVAEQEFEAALRSEPHSVGPTYRRHLMHKAQEIARRHVLPWLQSEQQEGETRYRQVSSRFVQMGNEFLRRLAGTGIPALARLPHALDPDTGFTARSEFSFREFIEIAEPASPLRWLADLLLGSFSGRKLIERDARRFLDYLFEINSSRVQSDILNRVQESRSRLEVEIRKLLHEVSRVAEQALMNARKVRDEGAPAIERALARLASLEHEIRSLESLPASRDLPFATRTP